MSDAASSTLVGGWLADLRLAAGFLTRVVAPPTGEAAARPLGEAARAFPLVGAGLGLGAGVIYAAALTLGLAPPLAALCAVASLVVATGALHEDGLADVADGLGAGGDAAARLAVMRDSRTGVFGVVAVVLVLSARVLAVAALAAPWPALAALVAAAAVSRGAVPAVMHRLPAARSDGLGAGAGRPTRDAAILSAGLGAVVALIVLETGTAVVALAVAALVVWGVIALARRLFGGHTGDVLGAAQQAAEVAVLFAAAALA